MLRRQRATIVRILQDCGDTSFLEVALDDRVERAVNYVALTGPARVGDEVIVNTIALELGLGSGGYHFVMANLSEPMPEGSTSGHIIKLRYTPLQMNVLAAEEDASPHHDAMCAIHSLAGMPVVVATMHSMIAPQAAGLKAIATHLRVAYVMTDSAALAMGFSQLVRSCKEAKLIDATVTIGQAFGGDFEAVNVYSGLLAARAVLNADAVIVAPGVGHVGTGTPFGFSGIEQAHILDAVNALGGRAVAALRISFADMRERHHGVSHHSLTLLGRLTHTSAIVVVPVLGAAKQRMISEQLTAAAIDVRHQLVQHDGAPALAELAARNVRVTTMGRNVEQDRAFFLAAGAAGAFAGSLLCTEHGGNPCALTATTD